MRTITITIKERNNGENASINVQHSNNGIQSDIEAVVVNLLDSYLLEKVSEITGSEEELNKSISQDQDQAHVN